MKQQKQEPVKQPELLYREWSFSSHHPGLHQVLLPSSKDKLGNLIEEQFEANFGGDTGREGRWSISDKFKIERDGGMVTAEELVEIMRMKIQMKPVADCNITETTQDKENGDPVYKPLEEEPQVQA